LAISVGNSNNNKAHKAERMSILAVAVAEVLAPVTLDVTHWLSLKRRRLLNSPSRRERHLASNSPCHLPEVLAIIATLVPAGLATLQLVNNHPLLAEAVVAMVAVRAWLSAVEVVMLVVVEEVSSFPDLKPQLSRIITTTTTTRVASRISSAAVAQATGGRRPETLKAIGASLTTSSSPLRRARPRTWATLT
jgi:hypothetical protein